MSGAAGTSNKWNHQRDNLGLYERRIGTKEGGRSELQSVVLDAQEKILDM